MSSTSGTPRRWADLRPLPRSFYARPSPALARDLLGRRLVRYLDGSPVIGRIVETEAYQQDDPASHSYRGRTARTEVMFGPPGHLYVYFSYGVHWCMNIVTGRDGEGSAVLLRAAEPVEGLEAMRARRGARADRLLCSGPGRLAQAFGIAGTHDGLDLVEGDELWVAAGHALADEEVGISDRVGISVALERPWRFYELRSPFVSRGPRIRTRSERGSASVSVSATAGERASRTAKGRGPEAGGSSARPGA
jgi:DNA-3-methyladenine glycosylase